MVAGFADGASSQENWRCVITENAVNLWTTGGLHPRSRFCSNCWFRIFDCFFFFKVEDSKHVTN